MGIGLHADEQMWYHLENYTDYAINFLMILIIAIRKQNFNILVENKHTSSARKCKLIEELGKLRFFVRFPFRITFKYYLIARTFYIENLKM